jgi:hypothetical protein
MQKTSTEMCRQKMGTKEISLEKRRNVWYFIGRLLKGHLTLRTRQDFQQGVPIFIGICEGMIDAEVKPEGGTSCPRSP